MTKIHTDRRICAVFLPLVGFSIPYNGKNVNPMERDFCKRKLGDIPDTPVSACCAVKFAVLYRQAEKAAADPLTQHKSRCVRRAADRERNAVFPRQFFCGIFKKLLQSAGKSGILYAYMLYALRKDSFFCRGSERCRTVQGIPGKNTSTFQASCEEQGAGTLYRTMNEEADMSVSGMSAIWVATRSRSVP